ncbi:hypothetical protein ISS85_01270 [Candidatus Microgenomates bacterium]|nr:hypothetical protein [Candidatus Microgenomates bacterium]
MQEPPVNQNSTNQSSVNSSSPQPTLPPQSAPPSQPEADRPLDEIPPQSPPPPEKTGLARFGKIIPIIGIIAVIGVAAVVYGVVTKSGIKIPDEQAIPTTPEDLLAPQETFPTQQVVSPEVIKGEEIVFNSVEDIMENGLGVMCEIPPEDTTTILYIKGYKIRMDTETSLGEEGTILVNDTSWEWSKDSYGNKTKAGLTRKFTTPIDPTWAQEMLGLSQLAPQLARCYQATINESLFVPPTDVRFDTEEDLKNWAEQNLPFLPQ